MIYLRYLELRTERLRRGISQRKLAKRIGVDKRILGGWERGEHRPYKFNLCCWEEALGLKDQAHVAGLANEDTSFARRAA